MKLAGYLCDRKPITYNDDGKPMPDGYHILCCTSDEKLFIGWCDFLSDVGVIGFVYGDRVTKDKISEYSITVPWHRISDLVTVNNSDQYVLELQSFRDNCTHVWDDDHHAYEMFCKHSCVICETTESLHHDS